MIILLSVGATLERCIEMFSQATAGGGLFGAQAQSQPHNPMKDFEVTQPPDDSISAVRFSPKANFLVATSWDNNVRI